MIRRVCGLAGPQQIRFVRASMEGGVDVKEAGGGGGFGLVGEDVFSGVGVVVMAGKRVVGVGRGDNHSLEKIER